MFIWPAFDTTKILRYVQGGEGGAFFLLGEKTRNEVAVNLHLDLLTVIFNLLQRFAEM